MLMSSTFIDRNNPMMSLLSAGSNAQGQLGNASVDDSHIFQTCSFAGAPPGTLPLNTVQVLDIANGSNHTLVLLEVTDKDNSKFTEVWGCGDGRKGQLGSVYQRQSAQQQSTTIFHPLDLGESLNNLGLMGYAILKIGATWETSYLVLTQPGKHDVIVSFGSNGFGDLGIGRDESDKLAKKEAGMHIVDFSYVIINGRAIHSAQTIAVEKIRTGQRHIIVLLGFTWTGEGPTQALVGWGACRHGQLGDMPISARRQINGPIKKKGTGPTHLPRPTLIMLANVSSDPIIEYSLGFQHSVYLHASGRVSAQGSNRKNQTHGLDSFQNIRDVKCTWDGTYVLTDGNPPHILSIGSNSHGQLGRPDNAQVQEVTGIPLTEVGVKVESMVCGSEHLLLRLSRDGQKDEVWGWGWNEHGNLGIGNTIDSSTPLRIWPPQQWLGNVEIQPVRSVWAGAGSSWILCGTPSAGKADGA